MKRTEMMNGYTRQQVNEAIYTVLTSEYKKDAPEAFELVKKMGYDYTKFDRGIFEVYNPVTKRRIHLKEGGYYRNYYVKVVFGYYERQTKMFEGDDRKLDAKEKFDYVGCLEKPINKTWYDMQNGYNTGKMTALEKYNDLQHMKRMAAIYAEDVDKIKKQINDLQDKLLRYAGYQRDAEQELKARKQELGLA